jgi:hypothetical protein
MFVSEYKDVGTLNRELTRRIVYGAVDVLNATDTQLQDVMVSADSMAYDDFDLKKVWLTKNRWGALIQQYLDPDALEGWLSMIGEKLDGPRKRGVAFMRTNTVQTQTNASTGRVWRRWGSCMIGYGFRSRPHPHLSLHSRTTYLGYIAQIDLALACVLAREIGERVGLDPEDIAFTWHLEAGQFHAFKSLAWFFQTPTDRAHIEEPLSERKMKALRTDMPTLWLAKRTFAKMQREDEEDKGYGDHNFNQMLRIRRRYHAEVTGNGQSFVHGTSGTTSKRNHAAFEPLPSVSLDELDLGPVWQRRTGNESANAGMIDEEETA